MSWKHSLARAGVSPKPKSNGLPRRHERRRVESDRREGPARQRRARFGSWGLLGVRHRSHRHSHATNYGKAPAARGAKPQRPEHPARSPGAGEEATARGNAVHARTPAARLAPVAAAAAPAEPSVICGGREEGGGGEPVAAVLVLHLLVFFLGARARQAPRRLVVGRRAGGRIGGACVPAAGLPGPGRGRARRRVPGQRAVAAQAVGRLLLRVGVAGAALGRAHGRRRPHCSRGGARRGVARAALRPLPLRR